LQRGARVLSGLSPRARPHEKAGDEELVSSTLDTAISSVLQPDFGCNIADPLSLGEEIRVTEKMLESPSCRRNVQDSKRFCEVLLFRPAF
jgi:hypothetical protein